jgi:osmotically-inducible protein OsmY
MVNLTNRLPTPPPIARRRASNDAATRARMMASRLPRPDLVARRRAGDDQAARARMMGMRIGAVLAAFSIGALAHRYVFDRQNARRRRHMARERNIARVRRRARETAKRARYLEGIAEGMAHKAAHAVPGTNTHKEPPDDLTLAQKVESEAFRHAAVSKAHVSVNAEGGTVYLRGRLDSDEEIQKLVKATAAVDGVKRVESLLHTA